MRRARFDTPFRQRGVATLIVALVLIGIVSALSLASLSYGMQDRRAIADDSAARLAQEAAQSGLDQGLQFFRARRSEIVSVWLAGAYWQRCSASDTSLPCGIAAGTVRNNYFRHPNALDMRTAFADADGAPSQQLIAKIGEYAVNYDVYALLCLVDTQQPDRQCIGANDLAPENISAGGFSGPYAITLISRSTLTGEDGKPLQHAVARETIAPRAHEADAALGVVPGSWSDGGHLDMHGNYTAL
jgi:type II secretory pathway pseudopilin PulG